MHLDHLDREMVKRAVQRMQLFFRDLSGIYKVHGMDFDANTGRRNSMLSFAQERFFSDEIRFKYPDAKSDGRAGSPDIIISCSGFELECKLTSPNGKGAVTFRTDYSTLSRKGKLDYLYVIADHSLAKFAVMYFKDLTIDDFHKPCKGSREKSAMKKSACMGRCIPLMGSFEIINEKEIIKNREHIADLESQRDRKISILTAKLQSKRPGTAVRAKIENQINIQTARFNKKISDANERIDLWQQKEEMYRFNLVNPAI